MNESRIQPTAIVRPGDVVWIEYEPGGFHSITVDDLLSLIRVGGNDLPDLSGLNVWWRVDVWLHIHAWRFKWAWAWYCNNLERRLTKEEA
jgi:hypothetical protein